MEFLLSIKELDKLSTYLDETLKEGVILLRGDLASGKTTLVKSFVKKRNIDELVTSPTFSIQSIYPEDIYHYDVYNKTLEEFISLGLLEEFEKKGLHFVEWGDERLEKLLKEYGFETIIINIIKKENMRLYKINA